MLTDDQIERFSRHILLPEVGGKGEERLLASSVVVSGDGAAAECCAAYLAAAGVGRVVWNGDAAPLFLEDRAQRGDGPFELAVELGARGPEALQFVRAGLSGETGTLARGPCRDCLELAVPMAPFTERPELGAVAGSLAATESLLALVRVEGLGGRVLALDAGRGKATQRTPPRCAKCEGRLENAP